jgi:phosphodiesterase/alkaline phosphatase D-like protein
VRRGSAVELFILDTRTYRDDNVAAACTPDGATTPDVLPALGAPDTPEAYRALRAAIGLPPESDVDCLNALSNPARTLLGADQREWLLAALEDSSATFKFIVAPAPISEIIAQPYDRWEGYRAERDVILRAIAERDIENVIFLSTDLQASLIADVRVDLASQPVAVEAVAGPIAAETLGAAIARGQGERAVPVYEQLFQQVALVSCTAFDAYSYGLVEVDPAAGTATITLKDDDGAQLCRTVVQAP